MRQTREWIFDMGAPTKGDVSYVARVTASTKRQAAEKIYEMTKDCESKVLDGAATEHGVTVTVMFNKDRELAIKKLMRKGRQVD